MQCLSYPPIENLKSEIYEKKLFIISFFSTYFTIKLSTGHLRYWSFLFSLTLFVSLGKYNTSTHLMVISSSTKHLYDQYVQ